MRKRILSFRGAALPNPLASFGSAVDAAKDTCATRTQSALEAGGVSSPLMPFTSPFPNHTGIIAGANASGFTLLLQGAPVPVGLNSFNQ